MFLNYLAGVVSLVLAVSSFIPWVTIWFYSLKGIESIYGIGILLVGLLGVTVSAFQHLSGKIRGRAFIVCSLAALGCEGLYFKKMAEIGSTLNEILGYLTDMFGDKIMQKIQTLLGEQWSKVLVKLVQRAGIDTSLSSFDFIGGGLILAVISSIILLVAGILLEKNKTSVD
jgi:hypothetical protein